MKSPFAAKAMARGNFKRCRVLLGSNTNEGHYFIMYYLTNIFKKQVRWQDDDAYDFEPELLHMERATQS